MMLFLAITALLLGLGTALLLAFANGMSDAPSSPGMSLWPAWALLILSAALFVCWHFGWHPSW